MLKVFNPLRGLSMDSGLRRNDTELRAGLGEIGVSPICPAGLSPVGVSPRRRPGAMLKVRNPLRGLSMDSGLRRNDIELMAGSGEKGVFPQHPSLPALDRGGREEGGKVQV